MTAHLDPVLSAPPVSIVAQWLPPETGCCLYLSWIPVVVVVVSEYAIVLRVAPWRLERHCWRDWLARPCESMCGHSRARANSVLPTTPGPNKFPFVRGRSAREGRAGHRDCGRRRSGLGQSRIRPRNTPRRLWSVFGGRVARVVGPFRYFGDNFCETTRKHDRRTDCLDPGRVLVQRVVVRVPNVAPSVVGRPRLARDEWIVDTPWFLVEKFLGLGHVVLGARITARVPSRNTNRVDRVREFRGRCPWLCSSVLVVPISWRVERVCEFRIARH